jgi:hypothetical protein
MEYKNKVTFDRINEILSEGVRDMPQNPASHGLNERQIRAFYYVPEEKILYLLQELGLDLEGIVSSLPIKDMDLNTFTPEANKYYRHIGESTSQFTNGLIYLYNGNEFKPVSAEKGEKGDIDAIEVEDILVENTLAGD